MNTGFSQSNRLLQQSAPHSAGRSSRHAKNTDWPAVWHSKLCQFHRKPNDGTWNFNEQHVIAFLKHRVKQRVPAWKRLKIVEGLIEFLNKNKLPSQPDLTKIRSQLKLRAASERANSTNHAPPEPTNPKNDKTDSRQDISINDYPDKIIDSRINPREHPLLQTLRKKLRLLGHKFNTEKAYVKWTRRFLESLDALKHDKIEQVNRKQVEAFLTDLVVDGNVAASTQDQAFFGIKFFFDHVLEREIGNIEALRAAKPKLRPTVLSQDETGQILKQVRGRHQLIVKLLYGCGMRISEVIRLRVKDLDFGNRQIVVQRSKGDKSRLVPMPESVVAELKHVLDHRRICHDQDVSAGMASVWLPDALDRKFPNAHRELKWQYVFASDRFSKDPRTGKRHRHHLHRDSVSKAIRDATRRSGVLKYVTAHTFRHSFATHLLQNGTDVRVVQELLGHADINTTMVYLHVLFDENQTVTSPLDRLSDSNLPQSAKPNQHAETCRSNATQASSKEPFAGTSGSTAVTSPPDQFCVTGKVGFGVRTLSKT